jgi:Fe2+ transport system protein B
MVESNISDSFTDEQLKQANVDIANSEFITAQAAVNNVETQIEKDQEALAVHSNDGLSSYNLIADQNIQLSTAIQKTRNKNNTSNQKYNYQSGDIVFVNKINNYLFLIYYFVLLFVCYYLFYDNVMNWKIKVGILFVFVIYPYAFNLINYYLSKLLAYIYSIINITAYQYN